jgi:hypothetical protein
VRNTRAAGNRQPIRRRRRKTFVKRVLYLAVAALVAMLLLVPTALAQESTLPKTGGQEVTAKVKQEMTVEKDLPPSGGMGPGPLVLPAGALLLGAGVLGYAVLRRR